MNIEVPAFWHLDPKSVKTLEEKQYEERMDLRVVYVKLKKSDEVDEFGRSAPAATVFQISELFTKFGDINVSFISKFVYLYVIISIGCQKHWQ